MTRLYQAILLILITYIIQACSSQTPIEADTDATASLLGDPPTSLQITVPIKILQPEAWQCFQALHETQWHCQKDSDSPLTLSLSDIALEKAKKIDTGPLNTFPSPPKQEFQENSGNQPLSSVDTQRQSPDSTAAVAPSQNTSSQQIPMLTAGKLHNARNEVLNLPAHFYTLQLLAVKNKQKLIEFVETNNVHQPIYLNVANQDVEFHILLAGIFEDFEAAADQSVSLSGRTQIEPWIRQLGALQSALIDTPAQLQVSTAP